MGKFMKVFNYKYKQETIYIRIIKILSYLFKASPLPHEIKKEVIECLKNNDLFEQLAMISEC